MSRPLAPAGSLGGPDEHEVVVHHGAALGAEAFGDELLFGHRVVHEHDVGVAAAAGVQRLPGADGDHAHVDAGGRLEDRQQVLEQARLFGGRGRGHHDELVLRECRQRGRQGGMRRAAGASRRREINAKGVLL